MADDRKTALIFGISGQDGAYLADLLLRKGYTVHGTSRELSQRVPGGFALYTPRNLQPVGPKFSWPLLSAAG